MAIAQTLLDRLGEAELDTLELRAKVSLGRWLLVC